MEYIKSISSWFSLYLVGILFFLAANAFVIAKIVDAENIKTTVKQQGTYEKLVPTVLALPTETDVATNTLPLSEPWVKDVATKAFPASDLEGKGDTVIDGVFKWLNGETAQPQFTLDFTQNKQILATETGNYVAARAKALPACTLQNLPSNIDPYRIECLPPGVSPTVIARNVQNDIATSPDFLKEPVINSASTSENIATPNKTAEGLRDTYKNLDLLKWLLPALTVVMAVIGVLLATDKAKALRRLSTSFAFSSIGFVIIAVLITLGAETLVNMVSQEMFTREILGPIFTDLVKQARDIYLVFAAIALVSVGVIYAVKRNITHNSGAKFGGNLPPNRPLI